ncbi:MAG TPA: hypothetical protein VD997_02825 [Phycisphaerales bacterium]|nr:hypothetical protein [Phycisphaerales bacterium]
MLKALPLLLAALLLVGCSRPTSPEFQVGTGRYAAAFDAARETLRDYRFQLERVDAQQGVITTQPKATAGLVSMWDKDQSSLSQEVDDTVNNQSRVVRITFENDAGEPAPVDPAGLLRGRVEVTVYRRQSPGVRVSSRAIGMTTTASDPQAAAQGVGGEYNVPVSQDTRLAARLAAEIEKRLLRIK